MSARPIRFANNREATDDELNCIARAIGFMSWGHMRQVFEERDRDRAIVRAVAKAKGAA